MVQFFATVALKVVVKVPTPAVTVNVPEMLLAASVGAMAYPFAPVKIGMGGVVLNVPPAPFDPGTTVNVTLAPRTPLPAASVTRTSSESGMACHSEARPNVALPVELIPPELSRR